MSVPVKLLFEGEMVDADEMGFVPLAAASLSYQVSDGTRIDVNHELKHIYLLRDKKKPDGSPIYLLIGEAKMQQFREPATVGDARE